MKYCTLYVPSSKDPIDWFYFVNSSIAKIDTYDFLLVDFNDVYFLETDDFVILACLIESFYHDECIVDFTGGTAQFNRHLENIRFKEYWQSDFDRTKFTLSRNRTTLCLWRISKERIYDYSSYANKYFREAFIKGKDLVPLGSNLQEVFNNIFDHSQSETAYVVTQFFPKLKRLSFSVCDFGIGIPSSINNFKKERNENPVSDAEALRLSLNLGFSIKSSPRNRGMGLDSIREFSDSSNGVLCIISNNAVLIKKAGRDYDIFETNLNFKGTLITVDFDTTTLDLLDEEEQVFGF